jgi:glycine cleavage system H protein
VKPENLRFAKTHEWVALDSAAAGGPIATIGVSAFAVEALTDLVFMQLPEVGRQFKAGESFGEIESVKAVSDLYCPIAGEVAAVNSSLPDNLETLNQDPYGAAWLIKLKVAPDAKLDSLLDYAAYQKQVAEEGH